MKNISNRLYGETGVVKRSLHFSKNLIKESAKREPTYQNHVQFVRSAIVSVIAVVVNFGASYIFKEILGFYYLLAASLSFFLGVLVNYYLSVRWVFANRQLESKHMEFILFVVITTVGLLFNLLIIAGMVEIVKTGYWMALITATVLVFFWNFLARKKFLY
jgi:putative flippase GtrA